MKKVKQIIQNFNSLYRPTCIGWTLSFSNIKSFAKLQVSYKIISQVDSYRHLLNSNEILYIIWTKTHKKDMHILSLICTHTNPVITALESSNLVLDYNLSGCLGPDSEKCLSKWHFNKTPSNTQKVHAHAHAVSSLAIAQAQLYTHDCAQTNM